MATSEYLRARRNDLSGYLVHLTRKYGRASAKDNLVSILRVRTIKAKTPHCLFMHELNTEERKAFSTVCFSEVPLSDLNYLTHEMKGRSVKLSQYGLVFKKEIVQLLGGNPVFYLHMRSAEGRARHAALRRCFDVARKQGLATHGYSTFLPFVNRVDQKNDFSWEREWRVAGDFHFELSRVFLGLAPKDELAWFERRYRSFPWVSPRWGRDQMMGKMRELIAAE